jgi:MYXO-CTERM domain-containing protein
VPDDAAVQPLIAVEEPETYDGRVAGLGALGALGIALALRRRRTHRPRL